MEPDKEKKPAEKESLVQDITPEEEVREDQAIMKTNSKIVLGVYVLLAILGVGTGYLLAGGRPGTGVTSKTIQTETVVGSTDTKTFKDSAEGTIEAGASNGEGSHKLIREGGPSQTAYLVSSVVDLDKFIGKHVKVWGQTVAAQKVSWLMDVG